MPMQMLKLVPGVNVEPTESLLQAGYSASSFGRFRAGLFEKLGGWSKYFNATIGGVPRALWAWQDRNATDYLGVGTTTLLGTIANNVLTNLTPQTKVTDFTPDFSTVISTANVIIVDPNISNVTTFDSVEFLTPVSVGGLILSGTYPIDLSLSTHSYRIVADSNATGSVSNGGAVPVFTTTSGSSSVTVTLNNHGLVAFGTITFPLSTTVGGVTIDGTYSVVSVTDANNFVIAVSTQASSSTSASMNSGSAEINYYIALGPIGATTGYSVGTYSTGGYSTGASAGSQQTGTPITATDWTLDNWGDTFVSCPQDGGIYAWTPNSGLQTAQFVATAPSHNTGMFISMQVQMLICYGSTISRTSADIGTPQNKLLIAWSNVGDYTDFTLSTTSQAGSRILSNGSKVVSGLATPQQELIWTDLDLWAMNYLGSLQAGVWGFTKIGANAGLVGRHSGVVQGNNIYWRGPSNFFVYGGGAPQVIPCSVWDTVFQDTNTAYQDRCFAWSNTPFNEIWFFFPRASTSATECDYFVKLNTLTGLWDNGGELSRTCGIDSSVVGMPISASSSGIVYEHEVSTNADGQALTPSFQSGWFQLSDGQDIVFCDWLLPDFKWGTYNAAQTASIQITLYSVYYPGDTPTAYGPFTVTQQTQYINPRLRGRLAMIKCESSDVDSFWRIGGIRCRLAPDGRLP